MSAPKRIQRKRTKGWRMPADAVYVGRPTRWGNPFREGDYDGARFMGISRAEAVAKFDKWMERLRWDLPELAALRRELGGKDLACWCPLDKPCHADVLLRLANEAAE
jgi:hypothetical protein